MKYQNICEFVKQLFYASQIESQYTIYINELQILILDLKKDKFTVNQDKLSELQEGAQQLIEMKQQYEHYQQEYQFDDVAQFHEQIQAKILQLKNQQLNQAETVQKSIKQNLNQIQNQDLIKLVQKIRQNYTQYMQILQRISLFIQDVKEKFYTVIFNQFAQTSNDMNLTVQELIQYMRDVLHLELNEIFTNLSENIQNQQPSSFNISSFISYISIKKDILPEALYQTFQKERHQVFFDIQSLLKEVQDQFQIHQDAQNKLLDSYDQEADLIQQKIEILESFDIQKLYDTEEQYQQFIEYMSQLQKKGYPRYELMISVVEGKLQPFLEQVNKMQTLYNRIFKVIQDGCKEFNQDKIRENLKSKDVKCDILYYFQETLLRLNNQNKKLSQYVLQLLEDDTLNPKAGIQEIIQNLQKFDINQFQYSIRQGQIELFGNQQQNIKNSQQINQSTQKTQTINMSQQYSTLYQTPQSIKQQNQQQKYTVPSAIDYNNQNQRLFLQELLNSMRTPQLAELCNPNGQPLYPIHYKIHKFLDCLAYTNKAGKYVPLRFDSIQEVTTKTVKQINYGVRIQPKFGQQINFSFSDKQSRDRFYCAVETLHKFQNKTDIIIAMIYQ